MQCCGSTAAPRGSGSSSCRKEKSNSSGNSPEVPDARLGGECSKTVTSGEPCFGTLCTPCWCRGFRVREPARLLTRGPRKPRRPAPARTCRLPMVRSAALWVLSFPLCSASSGRRSDRARPSLWSAEHVAPRRAVREDSTGRSAGPLHLPQSRSHSPGGHRVRPLLQRGAPFAGNSGDSGSASGTEAASASGGNTGPSASPGWR